MGRRTHSGCDASESWHDRVGHRGKSSRSERIDHLSLWRWRPIRARRRKPAKNGLQKRALDGRRLQSLESRWIADGKIAIPRRLDNGQGRVSTSCARRPKSARANLFESRAPGRALRLVVAQGKWRPDKTTRSRTATISLR